jgi:hypothetical protein
MVAGRLTGSLDGRPVVIEADTDGLMLTLVTVRSLWRLSKFARSLLPVLRLLKHHRIPVRLAVAGIVSLGVLPQPAALVRFFAPDLRRLA